MDALTGISLVTQAHGTSTIALLMTYSVGAVAMLGALLAIVCDAHSTSRAYHVATVDELDALEQDRDLWIDGQSSYLPVPTLTRILVDRPARPLLVGRARPLALLAAPLAAPAPAPARAPRDAKGRFARGAGGGKRDARGRYVRATRGTVEGVR